MAATKKDVAIVGNNLPGKLGEAMSLATVLSKSGVVPTAYAGRPDAVFAVVQYGKELGIPPMVALQNMAFINGRPSMGSDLLAALAHKHPDWAGYEVKVLTEKECSLIVYRKNPNDPKKPFAFPGSFTMDEARAAGLVRAGGPWEKWKKRMLKHRAFAFALRDGFPDAFSGLYTTEEMAPDTAAMEEEQYVVVDSEVQAKALDEEGEGLPDLPSRMPKKVTPAPTAASSAKNTGGPTRIVKGRKI